MNKKLQLQQNVCDIFVQYVFMCNKGNLYALYPC